MASHKKDIYVLHIDAHHVAPKAQPHAPATHEHAKHVAASQPKRLGPKSSRQPVPKQRHWRSALWDKLEFPVVTIVVFFILYSFLNWQALAANLAFYWDAWRGRGSDLEHLVPSSQQSKTEALLPLETGAREELPIPPLNLEVMPSDTRVVLPRINKNVPIVGVRNDNLIARQWDELEKDIQVSLRDGVIHYPGTALPGEGGNVVLTGHSSYYAWDPGRFKDVFALLHQVQIGDTAILYFNQKKYVYEIEKRVVVLPEEVDVLASASREQLTLITCTPIGTNLKRLVMTAKLVRVE